MMIVSQFYYVYILHLSNGSWYVGYSANLRQRLQYHESGRVRETKGFLPVSLECYVAFRNKIKALSFEKYLKRGSGFAFRNRHLIDVDF